MLLRQSRQYPISMLVKSHYQNIEHIPTTRQRDIETLISYCKKFPEITGITLFGDVLVEEVAAWCEVDAYFSGHTKPATFESQRFIGLHTYWEAESSALGQCNIQAIRDGVTVYGALTI